MTLGHNYDFDSDRIVASIVSHGGNVYAQTARYNYGPAWFLILFGFHRLGELTSHPELVFRLCIVTLLTLADIGIALLLWKRVSAGAAVLFYLSPIAVIITGFHNQLDNIAVLIGLVAAAVWDGSLGARVLKERKYLTAAVLLGLSISLKHVLFFLPVWLALKDVRLRYRVLTLAIPVGIFAAAFVPYWSTGHAGIIANVFRYQSFDNHPLWSLLLPPTGPGPRVFFVVALIGGALLFRREDAFVSTLLYTLVVVTFAPAVTNQVFAIVGPAVAAFLNLPFVYYMAITTLYLLGSPDGLMLSWFARDGDGSVAQRYKLPILTLFLGVVALLARGVPSEPQGPEGLLRRLRGSEGWRRLSQLTSKPEQTRRSARSISSLQTRPSEGNERTV